MPHKSSRVNKEVRADKPIIDPVHDRPVQLARGVKFTCIGEDAPTADRCIDLQIAEGAQKKDAIVCERTCVVKLIRATRRSRRIPTR